MMAYRVLCHLYEGRPIDLGTFAEKERASQAIDEDMAEWTDMEHAMALPPNVSHYEIVPVRLR